MVQIGDLDASIPLYSISHEFGIDEDSPDGLLLKTVSRGLAYVKDIRPGDAIPRELLDGSASWSVEERHKEKARNKLMVQVARWATGVKFDHLDEATIQEELAKPESKERIQKGFSEIAAKLGFGESRKQEVVDLIETLARELAYIEALRERFQSAGAIQSKLRQVSSLYRGDRQFQAEIQRINSLLDAPVSQYRFIFEHVDGQTGELLATLKTFDKQLDFIREQRDELHRNMLIWDDVIDLWTIEISMKSKAIREAAQKTYRFVAQNFPQTQDW